MEMTDLGNFGSFSRWSAMKINFVILLKFHPYTSLWMFSWYVSKQIPCKHGVEITLVQRCFSVVTLKQHWIKVISTSFVCRLFIWTPIPVCLWTPCDLCKSDSLAIHLKIRKQLMKVAPWKKLFLSSDVHRGYKRGTLGWNELKSLTCFFPMFPFYTPWKHHKTKGYLDNFRSYKIGTSWKSVKQSLS